MSVARVIEHSNLFDDIIITSKFKISPMQCKITTGISKVKFARGTTMEISKIKHKRPLKSLRSNFQLIKNDVEVSSVNILRICIPEMASEIYEVFFFANVECLIAHFSRSANPNSNFIS